MDERERKRDQMRRDFPQMAKVVDEYRALFVPGVKLLWAQENGKEIGTPQPKGVPITRLPKLIVKATRQSSSLKR